MSPGDQKYRVALFTTLGISLLSLLIISSGGGTPHFRIATGQQEDQHNPFNPTDGLFNQISDIEDQIGALSDFTQNQIIVANQTGTAALSANLTQSDFD